MAQEQTILPKGIVLNRKAIYEEIAKYDVIPEELILKACHGKLSSHFHPLMT
jgi:hypothetical protein